MDSVLDCGCDAWGQGFQITRDLKVSHRAYCSESPFKFWVQVLVSVVNIVIAQKMQNSLGNKETLRTVPHPCEQASTEIVVSKFIQGVCRSYSVERCREGGCGIRNETGFRD